MDGRPYSAVRCVIISALIFGILPSIEAIGVALTNMIAAVIALIGFGYRSCFHLAKTALTCYRMVQICIRYGPQLRAWSSIQHTDGLQ